MLRIGDEQSTADATVVFGQLRTPLRIMCRTAAGADVHVMWHWEFHIPHRRPGQVSGYLLWGFLARRRRLLVVLHEPEPELDGVCGWAQQTFWRAVTEVLVHSRAERDVFVRTVRSRHHPRVRIVDHHAAFRPATRATHEEARKRLGIDAATRMALCIGFFGPHKGFDRAITAFARAGLGSEAHLCIVGSVLSSSPEMDAHLADLRRQVDAVPDVTLVNRYVTDEEFDLWLLASDIVVLPYRTISSSSVAARARILGRSVIATAAGGLPEQLAGRAVIVADDDELTQALRGQLSRSEM